MCYQKPGGIYKHHGLINDNATKHLPEGHLDFRKTIFDNNGFPNDHATHVKSFHKYLKYLYPYIWSLCSSKPFFWKSMVWQWLPVEYTPFLSFWQKFPKNKLPVIILKSVSEGSILFQVQLIVKISALGCIWAS